MENSTPRRRRKGDPERDPGENDRRPTDRRRKGEQAFACESSGSEVRGKQRRSGLHDIAGRQQTTRRTHGDPGMRRNAESSRGMQDEKQRSSPGEVPAPLMGGRRRQGYACRADERGEGGENKRRAGHPSLRGGKIY